MEGLFWEDYVKVKPEKKAPPSKEPVVLKPYVVRQPVVYQRMSEAELIKHAGSELLFDTESFTNLFVIAFKHICTGKVFVLVHPFDVDMLEWILFNYTVIGFNSLRYDLPLAWLAKRGASTETIKAASCDIFDNMWLPELCKKYGISMPNTNHIDLIEVCPLFGSLKLYGARLHAKRIQDLPWVDQLELEGWQMPITIDYCINDLDNTELIYQNLTEQLQLRKDLSKEYDQNLMSKSDAQIAEAVIISEIRKITGHPPTKPKITPGAVYHFKKPKNLFFKTKYMKQVLRTVEQSDFIIANTGYLICPEPIKKLEVKIGNSTYRMGIGGLHSSEKCTAVIADDDHIITDRDVAGYYPQIILNCGLMPKNMGHNFLKVYRSLQERRIAAKKAGNQAVSENLKVTVNGTFGKTGSPGSVLYAPEVIIQILLGGQLYLLMLIEMLEDEGITVTSANTDGIVIHCRKSLHNRMLSIITEWEQRTGFSTEEATYKAIYSRDVNAYLGVRTDGKLKGKNVYYDPWSSNSTVKDRYWRFQKNPHGQICVEAIEKLITEATPIEQTIRQCRDITRFLCVKNVTGGAHWDGEYLGKVVRWYYATNVTGTINYINSNRIVGETEGAKPLMDLPNIFPNDVNYDKYIERAKTLLKDMAYE